MTRSVAIQAGGQSSRMGRDKGLVPLAGIPMIEHVLERVKGLGDEILITTNEPADYRFLGLPLYSDENPGSGALEGLRTALRSASGDEVLLVACDMPFLSRQLLEHLIAERDAAEVTIPEFDDRLQPFCCLYKRRCLHAVEAALAEGRMSMVAFHPDVQVQIIEEQIVRMLDPDGLSFFNVNTPEELEKAERIYRRRKG